MYHTKIDTADVDYPCQELSNGGLGLVVDLAFFSGIDFLSVYTWGLIQLYIAQRRQSKGKFQLLLCVFTLAYF